MNPSASIGRASRAAVVMVAVYALMSASAEASASRRMKQYELRGETYVSLKGLARFYGMQANTMNPKAMTLSSQWSALTFEQNSRRSQLNGVTVWLHAPLRSFHGSWLMSRSDMEHTIDPILRPTYHLRGASFKTIVLDPGHGGHDPGAVGRRRVEEKRVVFDVARRLRVLLVNAGHRALLTRDGDRYVTLEDRTKKARKWGADLFVSIHMNSSDSASAHGVETYVLSLPGYPSTNSKQKRVTPVSHSGNGHNAVNAVAGHLIQRELSRRTGAEDRGLRRARFQVLREAPCPAVLVEGGFVSNRTEENKMLEASYRQALAEGIANGIRELVSQAHRASLATP